MATLFHGDGAVPDLVLFGSGTIGRPVRRHLELLGLRAEQTVGVPWSDDRQRRATLQGLQEQLRPRLRDRPLRIIWAAGAAGFSATAEQAAQEARAFQDVVDLAARVIAAGRHTDQALHMISSAGGLYEGRTVRSAHEPPSPGRAYGRLKLSQERAAMRLGAESVVIHRPSSVYSSSSHGRRPGLIGTLVENAATQQPTTIYGAPTTLRDYVHAEDVGRHVAATATASSEQVSPQLLVSGRPATILEIVRIVETAMRRRMHLRYADPWNTLNIVFARSARAATFDPTPLHVGVHRLRAELLTRRRHVV